MRHFLFSAVVFAATALTGNAFAQNAAGPDIEILAVAPRHPDVKPYMLSLPAEGRPEHSVAASNKASPVPTKTSAESKPQPTTVARE
jgi:hypothetical protein